MKEKTIKLAVAVILLLSVAAVLAIYAKPKSFPETRNLIADAYPLYPGLSWGKEVSKTFGPMSGYGVVSASVMNISDLSAVSLPFEKYYADKLKVSGWIEDQSFAAGGPGSAIVAYKKGGDYIVLGYKTNFKGGGKNEPVQCPCDISFSVFSGKSFNSATKFISAVAYSCDAGKRIDATYYEGPPAPAPKPGEPPTPTGSVSLSLSDGRQMVLGQTISADGIRYANADESFVFWSKGNDAFVQEGGNETYSGCTEVTAKPQ